MKIFSAVVPSRHYQASVLRLAELFGISRNEFFIEFTRIICFITDFIIYRLFKISYSSVFPFTFVSVVRFFFFSCETRIRHRPLHTLTSGYLLRSSVIVRSVS